LIRDIQVDTGKYPLDRAESEDPCPLNLITVARLAADGNVVENVKKLPKKKRKELEVRIEVAKEYCPCCRVCEFKLPEGVISVKKFMQGKAAIRFEKCPEGCTDCLDVCPVTGALYYSDEDKKVHVDEMYCVYCGACKVVCPVPEALELKRTKIIHTPVRSGTWNKALERLASPVEMSKELKARGSQKARESVEKRLGWKVA